MSLIGEGEFALIREHLEIAVNVSASWVGNHDVLTRLTDVAVLQKDEAAIRQYAPQAEELAVRYDHKLYQAIVHRAWGVAHRLAGEYSYSEKRLNTSLTLFRSLNTQWQIGRTLFELGELSRDQGDVTRARNAFTSALSAFNEMKAYPDIAHTNAVLNALSSQF